MLSELEQLLTCRRERENRAASALRQARQRQNHLQAAVEAAEKRLEDHHDERKARQDKLYRRSLRNRLTKREIDDLNIELDLMAEETDALVNNVQQAKAAVEKAMTAVEEAKTLYRSRRLAGDRFGHLVDDVARTQRRQIEQAEEFAAEDDIDDRRAANLSGMP